MMNQFMGEYNHTMDAKGRLIVPARFREAGGDKFIVTKGLDGCLFVFTEEKWDSVVSSMENLPVTQGKARKFARFLMGGAGECEVDKQGRILIPNNLRAYAHLEKDVVLVGVGSRVEIWNRDTWEEANVYDEIEEIAEDLEELRF
ncbi:division/cell wall cluster transcriptional repressor MraZ [Qiania dongpingensis]|uniref:Transcriptional regulator MraZ n=2 Tax=Qiania dongpingensis TaxID=2763669 RepID=A0A7G9G441_9FIRM|nr:division/cell wall cluster transcriptional repressor MraZ [Qiania dongpingensis]QNM05573.1 division/cell wall cluster transcriptional repressor MraZ [Qiania dongpingensis]